MGHCTGVCAAGGAAVTLTRLVPPPPHPTRGMPAPAATKKDRTEPTRARNCRRFQVPIRAAASPPGVGPTLSSILDIMLVSHSHGRCADYFSSALSPHLRTRDVFI